MKKIAVTAALAAIATLSATADAATYGATGGSSTAGASIALTAGTANTAGVGLKENVTLQLSSGNLGSVVYDDAAVQFGYAVGSTKGKGKAFQASSGGGAPKQVTTPSITSAADVTSGNLTTAATASASGS